MTDTVQNNWNNDNKGRNSLYTDENGQVNGYGPVHSSAKSKHTFSVAIANEPEYRKKLHTLSLQAWPQLPTPRRRELFKYAKVSLRSQDTRWAQVPRLAVIAGITHATWNKSVQALFSTQNCDVMFTLGVAIIYFQRILTRIADVTAAAEKAAVGASTTTNTFDVTSPFLTTLDHTMKSTSTLPETAPSASATGLTAALFAEPTLPQLPLTITPPDSPPISLAGPSPVARNLFFVSCIILALKYCDDLHLSNKYMSKIFKLPLAHINLWESTGLQWLDWRLGFTEVERAQVVLELAAHIDAQ